MCLGNVIALVLMLGTMSFSLAHLQAHGPLNKPKTLGGKVAVLQIQVISPVLCLFDFNFFSVFGFPFLFRLLVEFIKKKRLLVENFAFPCVIIFLLAKLSYYGSTLY